MVMKAFPFLLILLCVTAGGCGQPAVPAAEEPADATPALAAAVPGADLIDTTWVGHFSHENAEGAPTEVTWHFQSGGVIQYHRHWDNHRLAGTWRIEDGALLVVIGEYGKGGFGTIELEWKDDQMKGETWWRSGYGCGWVFELKRRK